MANPAQRVPENVPGDLYVDESCIDCDTCRWMASATFGAADDHAYVRRQPRGERERLRALQALVSCPTGSIGTLERHHLAAVHASLPAAMEGVGEDVLHCGYHSEASFGAASYLVLREDGNALVDSPRFTRPLVRRVEELGGVRWMLLTHVDDVADHERFRAHFGCERVIHARDARGSLRGVERLLEGDDPVAIAPDLLAVPTPGHTEGSTCYLHAEEHLFSGDHLAWSERLGRPYAFRRTCWYDWDVQTRSMRRLGAHRFAWILPGHGRRGRVVPERAREEMDRVARWMESRR